MTKTLLEKEREKRRAEGRCLLCGSTKAEAGEGCYIWYPVSPHRGESAPHNWPEKEER